MEEESLNFCCKTLHISSINVQEIKNGKGFPTTTHTPFLHFTLPNGSRRVASFLLHALLRTSLFYYSKNTERSKQPYYMYALEHCGNSLYFSKSPIGPWMKVESWSWSEIRRRGFSSQKRKLRHDILQRSFFLLLLLTLYMWAREGLSFTIMPEVIAEDPYNIVMEAISDTHRLDTTWYVTLGTCKLNLYTYYIWVRARAVKNEEVLWLVFSDEEKAWCVFHMDGPSLW